MNLPQRVFMAIVIFIIFIVGLLVLRYEHDRAQQSQIDLLETGDTHAASDPKNHIGVHPR